MLMLILASGNWNTGYSVISATGTIQFVMKNDYFLRVNGCFVIKNDYFVMESDCVSYQLC